MRRESNDLSMQGSRYNLNNPAFNNRNRSYNHNDDLENNKNKNNVDYQPNSGRRISASRNPLNNSLTESAVNFASDSRGDYRQEQSTSPDYPPVPKPRRVVDLASNKSNLIINNENEQFRIRRNQTVGKPRPTTPRLGYVPVPQPRASLKETTAGESRSPLNKHDAYFTSKKDQNKLLETNSNFNLKNNYDINNNDSDFNNINNNNNNNNNIKSRISPMMGKRLEPMNAEAAPRNIFLRK